MPARPVLPLATYIERFLTAWYPGEWPQDLPAGTINGETFADRTRRECEAAFNVSGLTDLINARIAVATHHREKHDEDRQNGRLPR